MQAACSCSVTQWLCESQLCTQSDVSSGCVGEQEILVYVVGVYLHVCMFKGACVCVCKCVYAHAGRVTDVVQRWVKDGELFGEDVLVHAEGPGVGTTDVEALLAKNHVDIRLQRAEREEHTAETKAHLVGPPWRREERQNHG